MPIHSKAAVALYNVHREILGVYMPRYQGKTLDVYAEKVAQALREVGFGIAPLPKERPAESFLRRNSESIEAFAQELRDHNPKIVGGL